MPDFAVVGVVAFPELAQRRDQFAQMLAASGGGQAAGHAIEFHLVGTACQAHFHAAFADHVEQGAFASRTQGMPEGRDQGAGAQADGRGAGREVGQDRHGAGGNGVFHRMMLTDPDGAEPAGFGHQG